MRKIVLSFVAIFALLVVFGCAPSADSYLDKMDELDEPLEFTPRTILGSESIWITHTKIINPDEVLYYAPKKVIVGDYIYINEIEGFLIVEMKPNYITVYHEATDEELELIFEE